MYIYIYATLVVLLLILLLNLLQAFDLSYHLLASRDVLEAKGGAMVIDDHSAQVLKRAEGLQNLHEFVFSRLKVLVPTAAKVRCCMWLYVCE